MYSSNFEGPDRSSYDKVPIHVKGSKENCCICLVILFIVVTVYHSLHYEWLAGADGLIFQLLLLHEDSN